MPTAWARRVLPQPGGPFEEEHLFFVFVFWKMNRKTRERDWEKKLCLITHPFAVWHQCFWTSFHVLEVPQQPHKLHQVVFCNLQLHHHSLILRPYFDCFSLTMITTMQSRVASVSTILDSTPPIPPQTRKVSPTCFFESPHKKNSLNNSENPKQQTQTWNNPLRTRQWPKEESMAWEKRKKLSSHSFHQIIKRKNVNPLSVLHFRHPWTLTTSPSHTSKFFWTTLWKRFSAFFTFFIKQNNKNSVLFFCHKNKSITRSARQKKSRNGFSVKKKVSSLCVSFLWQQLCVLSCCVFSLIFFFGESLNFRFFRFVRIFLFQESFSLTKLKETQMSSNDQRKNKRMYVSCISCWVKKHLPVFYPVSNSQELPLSIKFGPGNKETASTTCSPNRHTKKPAFHVRRYVCCSDVSKSSSCRRASEWMSISC